jgi:hypothetical protein
VLLDKNDADAHRIAVRSDNGVTNEIIEARPAPAAPTTVAKPDLYAELNKLDDLHKRGLLTDVEFEQLKQKLLAAQ